MACEVCEHCNTAVRAGEGRVHEGHSYHQRCYKCYVCSETNLRNAEIFKGVIFCSACSHRIFEDLSSAHVKKAKRRRKRNKNRVLEMTRNITSSSDKSKESSKFSANRTATTDKTYSKHKEKALDVKKTSNEMGTTTLVTQELLKHLQTPDREENSASAMPRKRRKHYKEKTTKNSDLSDLRIAELGKSTEIAHIVLRKSEMPVVIKSHSKDKISNSSNITEESDTSGEGLVNRDDSYSSKEMKTPWIDRRIGSILKLPYKSFKKNILERSSLISVVMSEERKNCIFRKFKNMFYEEITEHQRRGLHKLFSTINRSKVPHRLGWLQMKKIKENTRSIESSSKTSKPTRCKHYGRSHSYRCMRAHVMRRAGPTTSQLGVLRKKIKRFFFFEFIKGFFDYNKFEYAI